MRGFVNLELEFFIAHFVLPEILCLNLKAKQEGTHYTKQYNEVPFYFNQGREMFIHMEINRISDKNS